VGLGYSPHIKDYMYLSYSGGNMQHRYNSVSMGLIPPWKFEEAGHLNAVVRVVHVPGGGMTNKRPTAGSLTIGRTGNQYD
jgi:hypothetical protein